MEATIKKAKTKKATKKAVKHIDLKFNFQPNLQEEQPDLLPQKSKVLDVQQFKVVETVANKQIIQELLPQVQNTEPSHSLEPLKAAHDRNDQISQIAEEITRVIEPIIQHQEAPSTPISEIPQQASQSPQKESQAIKIQQQEHTKVEQLRFQEIKQEQQLELVTLDALNKATFKKEETAKPKKGKKKKDTKKTAKSSVIQQNFDLLEQTQQKNSPTQKIQSAESLPTAIIEEHIQQVHDQTSNLIPNFTPETIPFIEVQPPRIQTVLQQPIPSQPLNIQEPITHDVPENDYTLIQKQQLTNIPQPKQNKQTEQLTQDIAVIQVSKVSVNKKNKKSVKNNPYKKTNKSSIIQSIPKDFLLQTPVQQPKNTIEVAPQHRDNEYKAPEEPNQSHIATQKQQNQTLNAQSQQIQSAIPQISAPISQKTQIPAQSAAQAQLSQNPSQIQNRTASTNPIVSELINLIRFHNDQQIRTMRERIKMLEEDIRSRMLRTQHIKTQDRRQALSQYTRQTQLFKDIVEQNLSLKQEYSNCKNK